MTSAQNKSGATVKAAPLFFTKASYLEAGSVPRMNYSGTFSREKNA